MMEHAKKWLLVDPSLDARHTKRHYSALDQNISDVLNRQDVDDREKLRLYQVALGKFLANRQSVESELNELAKVPEPPKTSEVDQKPILEQLVSLLAATPAAEAKAEISETKAESKRKRSESRGRPRKSNRQRKEKSFTDWIQY